MVCPRCKSSNVMVNTGTHVVTKNRSCLWNLFMFFITCGLWIVWMLVRKRKEKVVTDTYATCQDCGRRWKIR